MEGYDLIRYDWKKKEKQSVTERARHCLFLFFMPTLMLSWVFLQASTKETFARKICEFRKKNHNKINILHTQQMMILLDNIIFI
jgi:hypothetical protein